jgi:hypothetical protein
VAIADQIAFPRQRRQPAVGRGPAGHRRSGGLGAAAGALLAAVSPYAGIQKRFVHYVVSANWGGAIFVWIMLPPALVRLFVGRSARRS